MQSFLSDLRLSVRRLASRPVATIVAIVTLSLGIGAVSTMYVLFRAAMSNLPPVPDAEHIARVFVLDHAARDTRIPPALAEREAWLDSPPPGVQLAVSGSRDAYVTPGNHAVGAQRVSNGYFAVAGVGPEIGRVFEHGAAEAVISRRLWDLLPDNARKLGTRITVDAEDFAIVGVMPAGFWMPARGTDVWLPMVGDHYESTAMVLARLDRFTSSEQASSALSAAVQHFRGANHAAQVRLFSDDANVRLSTGVLMVVGPAALVLVAVCANVAALLLGDVHRRRQELAVRAALGASPRRLAREVYSDAFAIATLGGVLALAGAFWSTRALRAAFASVSPESASMLPSFLAVAPMAAGATLAAVLGIGYLPAIFASRVRIVPDLTGHGGLPLFPRGRYGGLDLLLVLQIAVAAGLVLWTVLFASMFERMRAIVPHVPADRVWNIEVTARSRGSVLEGELPGMILVQANDAPGIQAAGLSEGRFDAFRGSGQRRTWTARSAHGAVTTCTAWLERIRGAYFDVHNFPVRGGSPTDADVVLNEAAVRSCGDPQSLAEASRQHLVLHIAGSVDDRWFGAGVPGPSPGPAVIYGALTRPSGRSLLLTVRSTAANASAVRTLRDGLQRSFPTAIFGEPESLAAAADHQFGQGLLITKLFGVLACLALFFGLVGLHAAIAQALAGRTREIGVRVALGASGRHVVNVALGHHAVPAAIGIVLGASVAVAGLLTLGTDDAALIRQLAVLTARSPATWGGLVALLVLSMVLSASGPVMRALRVDPAVVLRQE